MTNRREGRCSRWALCLYLCLPLMAAGSEPAFAQSAQLPVHVRATLGMATLVSEDQTDRMAFETIGFVGDLQLGYSLSPWLDVRLGASGGGFGGAKGSGGLLQPQLGAAIAWPGMALRPWLQLDLGAGFTGPILRPVMRLGVGVDFPVSDVLTLAPVIGYWQLFQKDGPTYSTDARFAWFGVVLGWQPFARRRSAPRERVITRERIIQREPPPEPAAEELDETPAPRAEPSPELLMLIESTLPSQQQEWLAPVLFAYDSDVLEAQGVAMLHEVALELQRRPQLKLVEIRGYADARGSQQYNLALSDRRAHAVLEWLVAHGIERERLTVAAQGAADLVESGADESAHEQNRRVVFRVLQAENQ
ncbi:MAG TPA: OmpA family protein [Polyangiales bacterium]|nr:OmpA family protein [Polyangiales bacterium]